ncbi:MAG: polymer-forming cytoskeletal protein [Candidatus Methylomirabilales bacterium]
MLWKSTRKPSSKHSGIMAFIDERSKIEGKYTFTGTGTVLLNGTLQGEVVTTDTLIVGEKAVINATIRAESVVIMGEVVGNVQANARVELKGSARVFGDLEAPVVVLEEGVLFEGQCHMAATRPDEAARDSSVVPFVR